jgi:hypothetical protein
MSLLCAVACLGTVFSITDAAWRRPGPAVPMPGHIPDKEGGATGGLQA